MGLKRGSCAARLQSVPFPEAGGAWEVVSVEQKGVETRLSGRRDVPRMAMMQVVSGGFVVVMTREAIFLPCKRV